MRTSFLLVSLAVMLQILSTPAYAKLSAKINLSSQTMTVYENGTKKHVWKISSGKSGFFTPTGNYHPRSVERMHYSKKYDNAPMPYSVFFRGGYAVHGTKATWKLGTPASHGCVRLQTGNAKKFHDLVNKHGKSATSIKVVGSTPSRTHVRIASSSRVVTLGRTGRKARTIRKLKSARKSRYSARRTVKRSSGSNRYQAKGWNSNSWKKYSANMRRKKYNR